MAGVRCLPASVGSCGGKLLGAVSAVWRGTFGWDCLNDTCMHLLGLSNVELGWVEEVVLIMDMEMEIGHAS